MLIGIPGSGKSTYAEKIKNDYCVHLSSDKIREDLYGDASIQGKPEEVFGVMQDKAMVAFDKGYSVIYDATNLTRKDRASILSKTPAFVRKEAVVIFAPIEECIKRDAARNRTVGEVVIDRMVKKFQPPYYDEGFDSISIVGHFYTNEEEKALHKSMNIPHDNPNHIYSIAEHCYAAGKHIDNLDEDCSDILFDAAFWHDLGKPYCKSFKNSKGEITDIAHYYCHQNVGAWLACGLRLNPAVIYLIGNHMEPFYNSRYYRNLPAYIKKNIDILHEADLAAH